MKLSIKTFVLAIFFMAAANAFGQAQDTTFIVNGVCGMCEMTIEKAAKISGVSQAQWDKNTKVLELRYNPSEVSLIKVSDAINKSGYDTEFNTAPDTAYQALNPCCFYRDPKVVEDHK